MKVKSKYDENSIKSLDPRSFTRLRPSTYLGSNEYSTQLVRELFSNSLDEHTAGRGNLITVKINSSENIYSVEDNGQGFITNTYREDGETILQAAFDVMNTSGKYDEDGCYSGSLGLNGIGSKLTTFLSNWLEVITYNNNQYEHIWFKDGLFEKREVGELMHNSGTIVTWQPDPQFFQNSQANISDLKKLFEDISALCPELTIKFVVDDKEIIYHSENGLKDLIDKKVKDNELLSNRFSIRKIVDNSLFDIVLTYNSNYSDDITAYVNYGLTESGVHISTVKSLMTKAVNKYALTKGLIKKESDSFTSNELSEGLVIVFNLKAANVKYDSQVKSKIVDVDKTLINQVINNDFPVWLENNPKDAKLIVDRAMTARKAKDAAQKAKDGIRNAKSGGKKFISLPTKLVDAYSKNRKECSIYICEGDSAANGLIAKRNGKTQAVFPVRGKVLNCRKVTPDKIYANQEISNIVKALGLDIDKDTGKLKYDEKKLRYGSIIIATDADADGYQIRLLLINMFWWLCPELITNGHLWIAIPPLYRITTKKNEYIYLIDDQELNDYKAKHKNESYLINRSKGLGEQSPDELAYCLLKEETRNIHQISVKNAEDADNLLEIFMGDKIEPRRDYLLKHGTEVEVDVE